MLILILLFGLQVGFSDGLIKGDGVCDVCQEHLTSMMQFLQCRFANLVFPGRLRGGNIYYFTSLGG